MFKNLILNYFPVVIGGGMNVFQNRMENIGVTGNKCRFLEIITLLLAKVVFVNRRKHFHKMPTDRF